jgi:hypothetical protein
MTGREEGGGRYVRERGGERGRKAIMGRGKGELRRKEGDRKKRCG